MNNLFLCTQITRNAEPYDVVIYFRCTHFTRGTHPRGTWNAWIGTWDPPNDPEGEFEIASIEFDGEPEAAPLTEAERDELTAWFHSPAGYELAMERYAEQPPDELDWDAIRDARRDARMEWVE